MGINIPEPRWGSNLANIILDLEKLRTKTLSGSVPPFIFFQLKEIFHILETLGSARIEGNNTTLSEYVETFIDNRPNVDESSKELKNLDKAIVFIEENTAKDTLINRAYFSEVHKILTDELSLPPKGEGSKYPGDLRKHNVIIKNSPHTPSEAITLPEHFQKLCDFINREHKEQYQLLKVAVAHHRFEYIHPFDNGNGRIGRLLNYALLIKLGFVTKPSRIINPSSIFYVDRTKYYSMLAKADSLKNADILSWCEYFLSGLQNEIKKIDSLLATKYVVPKILSPALKFALEQKYITPLEFNILKYIITQNSMSMKSQELEKFNIKDSVKKSRTIKKLRDKKLLTPITENSRIYTISFVNNYLLRGVIDNLDKQGFIAEFLKKIRPHKQSQEEANKTILWKR